MLVAEHFSPAVMAKRSGAAASLCAWLVGTVAYYDVVAGVEPQRVLLVKAAAEAADADAKVGAMASVTDV